MNPMEEKSDTGEMKEEKKKPIFKYVGIFGGGFVIFVLLCMVVTALFVLSPQHYQDGKIGAGAGRSAFSDEHR